MSLSLIQTGPHLYQFTLDSIKVFLPAVIGGILVNWMSRLISQLHICILWPTAEGLQHWLGWRVCGWRPGTNQAHLSCFLFSLRELRALIPYVLYTNMVISKDQLSAQFTFHHLWSTWSHFLCLCLMTLVTNPIPNIPTRALWRLCSRYICLLFWLQLVCVRERCGVILTSG